MVQFHEESVSVLLVTGASVELEVCELGWAARAGAHILPLLPGRGVLAGCS